MYWCSINKLFVLTDQGNKNIISKSNIRNRIPIKKNLIEKGLFGLWKELKPHS